MKKIVEIMIGIILVFSLVGCGPVLSKEKLDDFPDGYVCEYRYGKNAKYSTEPVDIDFEFDKQMFMDLYNEKAQYNSVYLRKHIEECDLKLESGSKEVKQMLNTEISIRAAYEDAYVDMDNHEHKYIEVTVYEYEDDLYFFVLSMGGRTEKEKEGWYFIKVSDNLQEYWKQLTDQIYE
ncbi:MAG: hypothetical protein NC094_10545 [Bacteroidales bacterium]|nr:hypothetical protein [Lachnoclostridium sp.]MCM1384958.1 hypothetical protein [Lachnoclostridium sp.]MCM1465846.1 hypothetical protein [Bacteroidales bacterium]